MDRPLIWLAGETTDADFAPPISWLNAVASCTVVAADESLPGKAGIPSAIVLLQSRPGALSQAHIIETLHRRAPLARLISIVGPWCDGELRSGRPSHGVTRIHWHQWRLRLPAELGLVAGRFTPSVRIPPRTFTAVDRLLATKIVPGLRHAIRGTVAIHTCQREAFLALADACSLAGLVPHCVHERAPDACEQPMMRLLVGWESLAGNDIPDDKSPCILLLDWPRPDDMARAEHLGICQVLAQPLWIADLFAALDELVPPRSASTRANSAA